MKALTFAIVLVLVAASAVEAQKGAGPAEAPFVLSLSPGGTMPVGDSDSITGFGMGGELWGHIRVPALPVRVLAGAGGNLVSLDEGMSLYLLSGGLGIEAARELIPRLSVSASVTGGYYAAVTSPDKDTGGTNPFAGGGLAAAFRLAPSFGVGLEVGARRYFGLYDVMQAALGLSYHFLPRAHTAPSGLKLGVEPLSSVVLSSVDLQPIFPVFLKYYDTHPIGSVTLANKGADELQDLKITVFAKQFMDSPKDCKAPKSIPAGSTAKIDLYSLFNDSIMKVSEGTKTSVSIIAEGEAGGKKFANEFVQTMTLYDRNASTWDDDQRAAAFVTAKDPTVLKFSKNIAGLTTGKASKMINANLLLGMAMHEALTLYGVRYTVDPRTPYKELSKDKKAVDYLQFPRQTLEYKAGDCDDLSILYCALLESVGVPAAFITVPGHIYAAFSVSGKPTEVGSQFMKPDDLIVSNGEVWLPVEVTEIGGGFLKAWDRGARQWRENSARGQAKLYPIAKAWASYEPVGISGDAQFISMPYEYKVVSAFLEEVMKFIDQEITPIVAQLRKTIEDTGDVRAMNKLGVLYARYGLNDKAEGEFRRILARNEYLPALINMGNIYLLAGNGKLAGEYYSRASTKQPDNTAVLLGLARTYHEAENYSEARKAYGKLKQLNPDLAKDFAYLDMQGEQAARAAQQSGARTGAVWADESK